MTKSTDLLKALPEFAYVFVETAESGARIGIIKRGEGGYHTTDYDNPKRTDADIKIVVDRLNERLGVTKAQAAAMFTSSLFDRWDMPASDPANYDENGQLIRPDKRRAA